MPAKLLKMIYWLFRGFDFNCLLKFKLEIMKKTIYSLLLTLFGFSCTEDVVNVTPSLEPISTLKFENSDQIFNYFNSTINEQDFSSNRTSLPKESEFKSFKEVYHTAMKELDEVETFEQHNAFLRNYSDILTLTDSTYVPKITNPFYQAICNRDGIYESEGYAHKIIDSNYMVISESENIRALQNVNSISGLDSEIFRVATYNGATTEVEQGRVMANCGSSIYKDYFKNDDGCRKDRRVYVSGSVDFLISGYNYTPTLFAQAYGEKRNWLCNWKNYETSLATRDCSVKVTATLNGQNYSTSLSFPDEETTSDSYDIILHQGALTANPIYWQGGAVPTIEFTRINLEATSRGVGDNWVELNCQ